MRDVRSQVWNLQWKKDCHRGGSPFSFFVFVFCLRTLDNYIQTF